MAKLLSSSFSTAPRDKRLLAALAVSLTLVLLFAFHASVSATLQPAEFGQEGLTKPRDHSIFAHYLETKVEPMLQGLEPEPKRRQRLARELRDVYTQRDFHLAWAHDGASLDRARSLVEIFRRAHRHGLEPGHYQVEELAGQIKKLELESRPLVADLVRLEARLTATLLVFARDLYEGRIDAEGLEGWHKATAPADIVSEVSTLLAAEQAGDLEGRVRPEHDDYRRLAAAAVRYRALAARGGWPTLPAGETLAPGDVTPPSHLRLLAERLRAEGDLAADWRANLEPVFDGELVAAVRSFQRRHGLADDGKLGPDTRAAMNVSAAERVRQIDANLERWRWLPDRLPSDRLEINIPSYELRGYRDGAVELRMAVAVGKPDWATPIFEDEVLYAEVNPYWNVPSSIAADEILPRLAEDPSYLEEENLELVAGWGRTGDGPELAEIDWRDPDSYGKRYRLRQRPGPTNALGTIKFIFPNAHDVYLHDTPAKQAFQRPRRAVSHGCVRVAEPLALARFLFGDEQVEEMKSHFADREPRRLDLAERMPVIFHYWTAFVGERGRVHFRDDIYGLDEAISKRLAEQARPAADRRAIALASAESPRRGAGGHGPAVTSAP